MQRLHRLPPCDKRLAGVPESGVFRYIEHQTAKITKNERSVEELLADMLRKQDRQEALLGALKASLKLWTYKLRCLMHRRG